MRPGQPEPNEFELAILARIALAHPVVRPFVRSLRVLSREFTGVGSYTKFACNVVGGEGERQHIGLDELISVPHVPHGMGAVLFVEQGRPTRGCPTEC